MWKLRTNSLFDHINIISESRILLLLNIYKITFLPRFIIFCTTLLYIAALSSFKQSIPIFVLNAVIILLGGRRRANRLCKI